MRNYSHAKTAQPDLPDKQELQAILRYESKRSPAPGKESKHYPVFDTMIAALDHYGLSADLFRPSDMTIDEIVGQGSVLVDKLTTAIKQDQQAAANQQLDDLYGYLSEEDEPQKSDLIFVFGAKTPARIEKAIALFKAGFAPKIFITGGAPVYARDHTTTEADNYSQLATEAGVPESAIMVEHLAATIPDNVRRSLNQLDESKVIFSSLITVLSPYSQRRGYTTLQKYLPDSVKLYRVNAATLPQYQPDQWYRQADTTKVILNEFVKMRASVAYNSS